MPSTQLQHCLHCKSVYPHRVIVQERANTKIVHLICKNCNKCVNCDEPPLDPKQARQALADSYFAVVGGNETYAFKHMVSLIACNTQLAAAMFDYLTAVRQLRIEAKLMPIKISYWEGSVWKEGNFDFMRKSYDAETKQHYLNLYKDGQDTIKIKLADFISARPIQRN